MGLFDTLFGGTTYPQSSKDLQNTLSAWFNARGQKPGGGGGRIASALNDLFTQAKTAEQFGTPFYESLIPKTPGALSPAAQAEKDAATDALRTQLGSAGVAQLGQLNREYGGRLPASMVQSGFGSLARAGAGGATDIARQAIGENVNLGEQGVSGLAGLTGVGTIPLSAVTNLIGAAPSGQHYEPGAIQKVGQAAGSIAGAIGGFAGLGSGGGSGSSSGTPYTYFPGAGGNTSGSPLGSLPPGYNPVTGTGAPGMPRQYLPVGGP